LDALNRGRAKRRSPDKGLQTKVSPALSIAARIASCSARPNLAELVLALAVELIRVARLDLIHVEPVKFAAL
jgi:hypothetical protein